MTQTSQKPQTRAENDYDRETLGRLATVARRESLLASQLAVWYRGQSRGGAFRCREGNGTLHLDSAPPASLPARPGTGAAPGTPPPHLTRTDSASVSDACPT